MDREVVMEVVRRNHYKCDYKCRYLMRVLAYFSFYLLELRPICNYCDVYIYSINIIMIGLVNLIWI